MKNLKQMKCLETSIQKNSIALDTVKNWKNSVEGSLAYQEGDSDSLEEYDVLSYIEFTLNYLDTMYTKTYKKMGGKRLPVYE